jgi:uncharacterized protein YbjT (DUF2867 family)
MLITITGSTGTIGSELVRLLSSAEVAVRAVFRDASKTKSLPGVAWTSADLADDRLLEAAVAGTDRLFLLTDNAPGFAKLQIRIVRAAESLRVAQIVKVSALGASAHSRSWIAREHRLIEDALESTSVPWTILRPHAFMQNWLEEAAETVRTRGTIESPIGNARVPFIDARDVAAVAAEALLNPEAHAGQKHSLTGGEAVRYTDVAKAIASAIGSEVSYRPITMDEARANLESRGLHGDHVNALMAILSYQREGGPTEVVSPAVERILRRPPRTVGEFVRDHAAAFRR